ncbi:hypothetical protein Ct61P_08434 [Colletotrichum tofieldiae]|nr:hypothetical protein Ct61P_08434 [Colletotrichum tofieldiae]
MPMTREQLERLAETDVRDPISADVLLSVLASSPFIPSASLVNIRDLGSLYRCGTLEAAAKDPDALEWLATNVKHIFDIRSPKERERHPDPEVTGVTNTWFNSTAFDGQPVLEEFVEADGAPGLRKEYLKILDIYQPTFRVILEHSLAGASSEDVRFDYLLSRIGTEPARERLLSYARIGTGVTFDHPGFYNMCSLRPSCWDAFVTGVHEEHGGWEGYLTKTLGFSNDDLARIKSNLRGNEAL